MTRLILLGIMVLSVSMASPALVSADGTRDSSYYYVSFTCRCGASKNDHTKRLRAYVSNVVRAPRNSPSEVSLQATEQMRLEVDNAYSYERSTLEFKTEDEAEHARRRRLSNLTDDNWSVSTFIFRYYNTRQR